MDWLDFLDFLFEDRDVRLLTQHLYGLFDRLKVFLILSPATDESSDLLASPSPPGWTTAMLERLESHASAVWKSDGDPQIAKVRPSSANRSKLDALER